MTLSASADRFILSVDGLDELLAVIARGGYRILGPQVRDGGIIIDEVSSTADLPRGWGDSQEPGQYRLVRRNDDAFFGFAAPAGTWKAYLFPARLPLARAVRSDQSVTVSTVEETVPRTALLGVRGCDLAALAVHDRVLLGSEHQDETYRARREGLLIIGVNCSDPASTCFCTSMGTGPEVGAGADLTLTELAMDNPERHRFLLEVGSTRGHDIVADLSPASADAIDVDAALALLRRAEATITRTLPVEGLPERLKDSLTDPRWEDVSARCLACGNCTMACPTCFCVSVVDEPNLATRSSDRVRSWASCFELSHSYMHGGSVRVSTKSRYRQWMTHKLATWWDQFGTSGCVGCGRCIAWCPAGIDFTEEAAAIAGPGPSDGDDAEKGSDMAARDVLGIRKVENT